MGYVSITLLALGLSCGRLSHGPEAVTERELRVFAAAVYAYSVDAGSVPPDYTSAARAVMEQPAGKMVQRDFPDAIRGIDAWGRTLIYERINDHQARLRSVGENGIDEHGAGDDIQKIIDIAPVVGNDTEKH